MRSEAQKRADKKYKQKALESGKSDRLQFALSTANKTAIYSGAADYDLPLTRYIIGCCTYCHINNIDISEYISGVDDNSNDTDINK